MAPLPGLGEVRGRGGLAHVFEVQCTRAAQLRSVCSAGAGTHGPVTRKPLEGEPMTPTLTHSHELT